MPPSGTGASGFTSEWRRGTSVDVDGYNGQERLQSYPVASPNGKLVFYQTSDGESGGTRIAAASVETARSAPLHVTGVGAIGMVDDALVYARQDGAVMAVRFNERELRVEGDPIPLGEQVTIVAGSGVRAALAANGTLMYQLGETLAQLVFLDSTGASRQTMGDAKTFIQPRFSRMADVSRSLSTVTSGFTISPPRRRCV